MKKSNIIAIIIVIVVVVIGIAVGVRNNSQNSKSNATAQNTTAVQEEKIPVPDEAAVFFTDYTNLQNEASRKVETGELDMEKYTDLLQKGIEIAQMKETFESNGATDELNKQINDIKPYLYQIAEEMNSDLKDKFK